MEINEVLGIQYINWKLIAVLKTNIQLPNSAVAFYSFVTKLALLSVINDDVAYLPPTAYVFVFKRLDQNWGAILPFYGNTHAAH